MTLADRYAAAFPKSRAAAEVARTLFPCGVTHDTRMMDPFPVYVSHAKGSNKWATDGQELIDYFVGHGSHILGHSADDVVAAVQTQMALGTHPGSCHELEIAWGKLVQQLIPSAERLRFTGSGTEATMMALRLSRLFTGRPKFLKFQGHFHGWHDAVTPGADPPYDSHAIAGVPDAIAGVAVVVPPNDLNRVESALNADDGIGTVILEPTGGHWGGVPIRGDFLRGLREITTRLNRVLIFDEVITGFRVSPGGAQQVYGVTPDLTALAKILAGGLPGGCVAGRADILAFLEPRPGKPKMKHPGTYNANPLSASAGIATLKRIAAGGVCEKANLAARALRNELNAMFAANRLSWLAYGDFSMVRVVSNFTEERPPAETTDNTGFIPFGNDVTALDGPKNMRQLTALRQAMLLNGVDWWWSAGMTSCEHSPADITATVAAMEASLSALAAEGLA